MASRIAPVYAGWISGRFRTRFVGLLGCRARPDGTNSGRVTSGLFIGSAQDAVCSAVLSVVVPTGWPVAFVGTAPDPS